MRGDGSSWRFRGLSAQGCPTVTLIAGRLAQTPRRVHGVVGIFLLEAQGIRRLLTKLPEKFTYFSTTALTANSLGLRDFFHPHLTKKIVTLNATVRSRA
jgi:hypothetical protein